MTEARRAPLGRGGRRDLPRPRPLGPRLLRARDQPGQRRVRPADDLGRRRTRRATSTGTSPGLETRVAPAKDAPGSTTGWTATAFLPWAAFRSLPSAKGVALPPKAGRPLALQRVPHRAARRPEGAGEGRRGGRVVEAARRELPRARGLPRPRVRAGSTLDPWPRVATFRDMTEDDLPGGPAPLPASGWNQTEADWRLLLAPPSVFRAAVVDGRVVASAGAVVYGDGLAWVCMVLVDPAERGRGPRHAASSTRCSSACRSRRAVGPRRHAQGPAGLRAARVRGSAVRSRAWRPRARRGPRARCLRSVR